jgi:hypothetical protein
MFARPVLISARAVRVVVSACTFLVLFGIASGARAHKAILRVAFERQRRSTPSIFTC